MPVSQSEKIGDQVSVPTCPSLSSVPQATRNVSGKSRLLMVLTLVGAGVIGGEGCRRGPVSAPSGPAVPKAGREIDIPIPPRRLTDEERKKEAEATFRQLSEKVAARREAEEKTSGTSKIPLEDKAYLDARKAAAGVARGLDLLDRVTPPMNNIPSETPIRP